MATKKSQKQLKRKTYKLKGALSNYRSYLLNAGHGKRLNIFCEKTQRQRSIRHCPTSHSIFVDDQSPSDIVKPLQFIKGILNVPGHETKTQEFLESHPSFNLKFEIYDPEADRLAAVEQEDLILDIKSTVRKLAKGKEEDIIKLRAGVAVLVESYDRAMEMSIPELKDEAYRQADYNTYEFLDADDNVSIFEDSDTQRKFLSMSAISCGVLRISPNNLEIQWTDSKKTVCQIPMGISPADALSSFLESENGQIVAQKIVTEL